MALGYYLSPLSNPSRSSLPFYLLISYSFSKTTTTKEQENRPKNLQKSNQKKTKKNKINKTKNNAINQNNIKNKNHGIFSVLTNHCWAEA